MEKSEFLKEISSMTREEIYEKFKSMCPKVKKIYPVAVVNPNPAYLKTTSKTKS